MNLKLQEKENIREIFIEKGLTEIGFTDIEPFKEHFIFYKNWIKKGFYGEMFYLKRKKEHRKNVQYLYKEAKSVIVVAVPYFYPFSLNSSFKIAKYAIFEDYHIVLKKKLKEILSLIQKRISSYINGKIYVDTGPLLERSFAQKAGLGFIGKNTNLILFKKGSFFLLGEILLNAEIEPDKPVVKNFCGKCTFCISACPTHAITEPFVIDARKCISYLTIEYRGDIDYEYRRKMGNWIFGCDICQDVCPWNKSPLYYSSDFFKTNDKIFEKSLNYFLNFSKQEYNEFFRQTPIKRISYDGFIRNCKIALENITD